MFNQVPQFPDKKGMLRNAFVSFISHRTKAQSKDGKEYSNRKSAVNSNQLVLSKPSKWQAKRHLY